MPEELCWEGQWHHWVACQEESHTVNNGALVISFYIINEKGIDITKPETTDTLEPQHKGNQTQSQINMQYCKTHSY